MAGLIHAGGWASIRSMSEIVKLPQSVDSLERLARAMADPSHPLFGSEAHRRLRAERVAVQDREARKNPASAE